MLRRIATRIGCKSDLIQPRSSSVISTSSSVTLAPHVPAEQRRVDASPVPRGPAMDRPDRCRPRRGPDRSRANPLRESRRAAPRRGLGPSQRARPCFRARRRGQPSLHEHRALRLQGRRLPDRGCRRQGLLLRHRSRPRRWRRVPPSASRPHTSTSAQRARRAPPTAFATARHRRWKGSTPQWRALRRAHQSRGFPRRTTTAARMRGSARRPERLPTHQRRFSPEALTTCPRSRTKDVQRRRSPPDASLGWGKEAIRPWCTRVVGVRTQSRVGGTPSLHEVHRRPHACS
jgi:hypothetical protein